jgi:Ca-activated chloride channel family protein
MKAFILFTLSLLACFTAVHSQTTFDKVKHDFEQMDETSLRYVDFHIKNNSDKKAYLLSVKKPKNIDPRELSYMFDKKFLDPDSSMILRIHVNPKTKGRFKYVLPVYMSDKLEATNIEITGEIKEMNQEMSSFQSCPNFNQSPNEGNPFDFKLTVKVIDRLTREPIERAQVNLIRNGRPHDLWTMDRKGYKSKKSSLGYYYFYATKEGYRHDELGAYVNFKRNVIILELDREQIVEVPVDIPLDPIPVIVEPTDPIEDSVENVIEIDITQELEEQIEKEVEKDTSSTPVIDHPKLNEIPEEEFSEDHFKFNNIVFVIDKSGSMKKDGKLDLMKYALNQLTKTLRPADRIGLVSYADDAEIILESTSGSNKTEINEIVEEMRANGLTAGGKGIRMGLKLAYKNFIKGGNNEVIVITDGSFSKDSKDYWKHIKKYRKKGINVSVVGIKNNTSATKSMKAVSDHGGGDFIPINQLSDAQLNLIKTIRLHSFKH